MGFWAAAQMVVGLVGQKGEQTKQITSNLSRQLAAKSKNTREIMPESQGNLSTKLNKLTSLGTSLAAARSNQPKTEPAGAWRDDANVPWRS